MPWALERPDPALATGIGIRGDTHDGLARDATRLRARLLAAGLSSAAQVSTASGLLRARIRPDLASSWAPRHDTTALPAPIVGTDDGVRLDREILVALLLAPERIDFPSLDEFDSALRIRRDTVAIAGRAALAFDCDERRPAGFWKRDRAGRFVLGRGRCLLEALQRAIEPEPDGSTYAFGCYRATEYVMLLAIAREAARCNPGLLARLRERFERRPIQSREFHETLLQEHGTVEAPLPARWFVPGDRVWFRNPDERSADVEGFEGSWVIYMGGGLFSNFWKHEQPYTLEDKCIEIFHWRDGAYQDEHQEWQMDEARVEACVAATQADAAARTRVLQRMMRLRDPQGVYAEGGCLDASREQPKSVWPQRCALQVQPA